MFKFFIFKLLYVQDRESIDTVVHVSELQQYDIIFSEPNQTSSPNQTRASKKPRSPNQTPTKENQFTDTHSIKSNYERKPSVNETFGETNLVSSTPVTVHVTDLDDDLVQTNLADLSKTSEDDNSFWESEFENSQHVSRLQQKVICTLTHVLRFFCSIKIIYLL